MEGESPHKRFYLAAHFAENIGSVYSYSVTQLKILNRGV